MHQQLPFFSEQWCGRRLWAKTPLDESIGCLAVVVLPSYSKLLRLVTQEPSLLPNSSSLCCTATISSNCASSLDSGIREIALYTKRYIAIQSHNRWVAGYPRPNYCFCLKLYFSHWPWEPSHSWWKSFSDSSSHTGVSRPGFLLFIWLATSNYSSHIRRTLTISEKVTQDGSLFPNRSTNWCTAATSSNCACSLNFGISRKILNT